MALRVAYSLVFLLLLRSPVASGLYEDQIGKFDWRQQYVGSVTHAWFEGSGSAPRRVLLSSAQRSIAALSSRSGEILWRQVLPEKEGPVDMMLHHNTDTVTLSGRFLRSWDTALGALIWEAHLSPARVVSASPVAAGVIPRSLLLLRDTPAIQLVALASGDTYWDTRLRDDVNFEIMLGPGDAGDGVGDGGNVVVVMGLDAAGRRLCAALVSLAHGDAVAEAWLDLPGDGLASLSRLCVPVSPRRLACVSPSGEIITVTATVTAGNATDQHAGLLSLKSTTDNLESVLVSPVSTPVVLLAPPLPGPAPPGPLRVVVRSGPNHHALLSLPGEEGAPPLSLLKDLPNTLLVGFSAAGDKWFVAALSRKNQTAYTVCLYSLSSGRRLTDSTLTFSVDDNTGAPEKMFVSVSVRRDDSVGYRVLLKMDDASLFMVQQPGRVVWCREEALSDVLTMELVDLPLSGTQAQLEGGFSKKTGGLLFSFAQRLSTQAGLLQAWLLRTITAFAESRRPPASLASPPPVASPGGQGGRRAGGPSAASWAGSVAPISPESLARDDFNIRKMMVMVTGAGKLFGLESESGRLVWSLRVPALAHSEVLRLVSQRGTAHYPHPPLCALVIKDRASGLPSLVSFNPISGRVSSAAPSAAPPLRLPLLQTLLLPPQAGGQQHGQQNGQQQLGQHSDSSHTRPLLLLHTDLTVSVFPSTEEIVSRLRASARSVFFYVANVTSGTIQGYQLQPDLSVSPVWRLYFSPETQTILSVEGKRAGEHIHSPGRVMGDRSVMYKYMNRNVVAVALQGLDVPTPGGGHQQTGAGASERGAGGWVAVALVDTVTGSIVHWASVRRARGPLRVVHSENWLVLQYWNSKSRRAEITSLELFERDESGGGGEGAEPPTGGGVASGPGGRVPRQGPAFSSLSPPPRPLALRQSYILPASPTLLGATVTERGITSRSILVALSSGGIVSLPRAFLDPRRPDLPTEASREEGLIPYSPELPLPTEWNINYNQSVAQVRAIHTSPTGLESTCLVVVYGLDLFQTRVHPSKMFDVLKDDFDFVLIGSVLLGLVLASAATRRLAQVKMLNAAWR